MSMHSDGTNQSLKLILAVAWTGRDAITDVAFPIWMATKILCIRKAYDYGSPVTILKTFAELPQKVPGLQSYGATCLHSNWVELIGGPGVILIEIIMSYLLVCCVLLLCAVLHMISVHCSWQLPEHAVFTAPDNSLSMQCSLLLTTPWACSVHCSWQLPEHAAFTAPDNSLRMQYSPYVCISYEGSNSAVTDWCVFGWQCP